MRLFVIAAAFVLSIAGLSALGVWQLERRAWKLDLIARVESRIHAAPVPAPGPSEWAGVTRASAEYRRVQASGIYLYQHETFVQALTERGAGFWVLTPLQTESGYILLVNRGFVPSKTPAAGRINGPTVVTGLLRIAEPEGGFLRSNDPKADHWYSRDVAAISAARHLTGVAPYFIDADAKPNPGGLPVGGLTVTTFRNTHLQYAITWFTLALMLTGGAILVIRHEIRMFPTCR